METERKRRIGVLGGSFNPVHNAHLQAARLAFLRLHLDEVRMLIAHTPPHKQLAEGASDEERLITLCLAVQGEAGLVADDRELHRDGKSYTVLSLEEMQREEPGAELFLIIGSDMLRTFTQWYRFCDILKLCTLCVVPRRGQLGGELELCRMLEREYGARTTLLEPVDELSSTAIRDALSKAQPIEGMVPPACLDYIYENALYQPAAIRALAQQLRAELKPSRYVHSVSVMRTAVRLAHIYGVNPDKARLAGLMHDCAKCLDYEELKKLAPTAPAIKPTIHAPAGAVYASSHYAITDPEVLQAIAHHCTGEADMSLLDKVVFIADFIEPKRRLGNVFSEAERAAYGGRNEKDLNRAILLALERNICYIKDRNYEFDPATLRLYKSLEETDDKIR